MTWWWGCKAAPKKPSHETQDLLDRMDLFLVEMQRVADRLVERMNRDDRARPSR